MKPNHLTDKANLDLEQVPAIRRALLLGLAALGELERLHNAQEVRKLGNLDVPEELLVGPGDAEAISRVADALLLLEGAAKRPSEARP